MDNPQLDVVTPVPGTALLLDLRNFTGQLDAATQGEALQKFCGRLARFYALCREAADLSANGTPYHMASTGDGMLAVFHGPRHVQQAFVCALLLRLTIPKIFPTADDAYGNPVASFGMGLESGEVCRVMAGGRATYIGRCINLAARLEAITKTLDSVDSILGEAMVGQLYAMATGEDFQALSKAAVDLETGDEEHLRVISKFGPANHTLCLSFLHYHRLKGVDRPVALHGLSRRASVPGNPRFDALLRTFSESPAQHEALCAWLGARLR